jgi:hypothetical protein
MSEVAGKTHVAEIERASNRIARWVFEGGWICRTYRTAS